MYSTSEDSYCDTTDTISFSSEETDHLSQSPIWDEYSRILESERGMEELWTPRAKRTRSLAAWKTLLPSQTNVVPEEINETRTEVENQERV